MQPETRTGPGTTPTQVDGTTELVHRVLRAPEHGAGYFFPSTASGTPLWVAGLAFALGLYSVVNAEWIDTAAFGIVLPVALAVGALAMTVGALWDFRAHDLLGGVAGMAYATFWLSFALLERFFRAGIESATGPAGYGDAFGVYLVMWSLVTLILAGAAWFVARSTAGALALLCATFLILGIASLFAPGTGADDLRLVGGYVGIVTAAAFGYLFAARMLNTTAGRELLPTWEVRARGSTA